MTATSTAAAEGATRRMQLRDVLTPLAERVGAVNTFWLADDGRLTGHNTDVGGFTAAVESLLGELPRNATIGLLGAGVPGG